MTTLAPSISLKFHLLTMLVIIYDRHMSIVEAKGQICVTVLDATHVHGATAVSMSHLHYAECRGGIYMWVRVGAGNIN
jgi:hypothetical protein